MGYKSERLELRLTPREVRMLDEVRGPLSRSAWVRDAIRRGTGWTPSRSEELDLSPKEVTLVTKTPPDASTVLVTKDHQDENSGEPGVAKHFHRPGVYLGERHARGASIKQHRCAEPGCTHIIER